MPRWRLSRNNFSRRFAANRRNRDPLPAVVQCMQYAAFFNPKFPSATENSTHQMVLGGLFAVGSETSFIITLWLLFIYTLHEPCRLQKVVSAPVLLNPIWTWELWGYEGRGRRSPRACYSRCSAVGISNLCKYEARFAAR